MDSHKCKALERLSDRTSLYDPAHPDGYPLIPSTPALAPLWTRRCVATRTIRRPPAHSDVSTIFSMCAGVPLPPDILSFIRDVERTPGRLDRNALRIHSRPQESGHGR